MKRKLFVILLSVECAAGALLYGAVPVQYLELTRKNLPSGQEIVVACLESLDFDKETSAEYRKRSRRSAWLPKMNVGATVSEDIVADWNNCGVRKLICVGNG